jgi:hypothetical protein
MIFTKDIPSCIIGSFGATVVLNFNINSGVSVAEGLRSLTSSHLPLTAVGSNPCRDFGFFHVRRLSS